MKYSVKEAYLDIRGTNMKRVGNMGYFIWGEKKYPTEI